LKSAPKSSPAPTSPASPTPPSLKAEVRIAETQAKDILIGQTRHHRHPQRHRRGQVARIDAAVQNGTVTVDVRLTAELPRGARPDLSVDGTIELERLTDVALRRPPRLRWREERPSASSNSTDRQPDAVRTRVKLGRSSVNTIEIVSGLAPGDRVILSDMSQWDANDRIKLN
jgi:HlyD family secretion protein